jgi:hypothetical protein
VKNKIFFLFFIFALFSYLFWIKKPLLANERYDTPKSNYPDIDIFLDLASVKDIAFQMLISNKANLTAKYDRQTGCIEMTLNIENLDLEALSNKLKYFKGGVLKKAKFYLKKEEAYQLEGDIAAERIVFIKENKTYAGDLSASGFLKLPPDILSRQKNIFDNNFFKDETITYHIDYSLHKGQCFDIENIEANGSLEKDLLLVKEGVFTYKKNPFQASGTLKNFYRPKVKLNIKNNFATITVDGRSNNGIIDIDELIAEAENSKIVSQGNLNIADNTIKLKGKGYLGFSDIFKALETFKTRFPLLDKLNPKGTANIEFTAESKIPLKEWSLSLSGQAGKLTVYGIEVNNINIGLSKNKEEIAINPLAAVVNNGKVDGQLSANLLTKTGILDLNVDGLDVGELIKQLKVKNKNYAGKLFLKVNLENIELFSWDKLKGSGVIAIKEGNIWQINFLKGLGEFLFIPDFEEIVFKDGSSELAFNDKNIEFKNIQLTGQEMTLTGEGKISIRGDIAFLFFPQFNIPFVNASEGFKKYLTAFLGEGGLAIEVEGTIRNPKYRTKFLSFKPLKNKIKGIFEKLLENPSLENLF